MVYSSMPSGLSNYYSYNPVPGMKACPEFCASKLKVEGTGKIKVQPNLANVVLGVIIENKELKLAQEENAAIMTSVINVIRGMGIPIEDIQTQSYNVTTQYDYIEGKQIFRGYRVEHMLQVIIRDMRMVGEVIDAAVQSGANQVSSIKFTIDNPSVYYQQALNKAVDDALAKAGTFGNKLNISVSPVPVQIVELGYGDGGLVTPMTYQTSAVTTPVQAGQIEITARIEAVFVYRAVS